MKKVIYGLMAFSPVLALAANFTAFDDFILFLKRAVGSLIPIFFGLAIIYFFWGLIEFIRSAGDPKKAAEGKSIMIYGVIAIAVMASIWGLVGWLQTVTGVGNTTTITPPGVIGL